MDHSVGSLKDKNAERNMVNEDLGYEISEGNKDSIRNCDGGHSCDILTNTLASFCPENLSEAEFKRNGIMRSGGEIARQDSVHIWYGCFLLHSFIFTMWKKQKHKKIMRVNKEFAQIYSWGQR